MVAALAAGPLSNPKAAESCRAVHAGAPAADASKGVCGAGRERMAHAGMHVADASNGVCMAGVQ
eukprot:876089-Pelagomonas_calceolata.AAC.3